MKYLLSLLLLVAFCCSVEARTRVPDHGVSVTSNAAWTVLVAEDTLDEAITTIDANLGAGDAIDIIHTANIAAVSGRVDTAEADITALEAGVLAVSGRVDTVETNLGVVSGRVDSLEFYTTNTFNVCTTSTTINVDSSMDIDDIHALGDTYDWLAEDVTLTYLFAAGTYTLTSELDLNSLIVPGRGSVVLLGTWTSLTAPETILNFTTAGSQGVLLDNHFRSEGDSAPSMPMDMQGFTIKGPNSGTPTANEYGVLVRRATLNLISPFRIEHFSYGGIYAGPFAYVYVKPFVTPTAGSTTPIYIEAEAGCSASFDALWARAFAIIGVSEANSSAGDDWCVFVGGDNYRTFQYANESAGIYQGSLDFDQTSASTASGTVDILVDAFGIVDIYTPGSYSQSITTNTINAYIK